MKKIVSIIMVCLLLLATMSGCNKGKGKDKIETDNEAKGRYIEEDIEYPEGVEASEYIALTNTPDGDLELYIYKNNAYEKYIYVDKKWTKDSADGLSVFNNMQSDFHITDIFYGEDGRQYLLGDTVKYQNALYMQSDNGDYEKLNIQKFDQLIEEWDHPVPYRAELVKVLKNGMIAISYVTGEIEVYSSEGQSMVGEFTGELHCKMAVEGNALYFTNQRGNEILGIDMETMKEEKSRAIETQLSNAGILEIDQTNAYLCDTTGIHLNNKGGSIWETIVDGNQTSLSMPSITLYKLIIGTKAKDDFYVVMKDEYSAIMKHYYYDGTASSVPPIELSIFSLSENKTIRQAITAFQTNHPEVKINYRVAKLSEKIYFTYGLKNPQDTVTQSDYVNALNTELLAKRGADILVMDSLPIDSYIEKGVLEDMESIFSPMLDNEELLGIAGNYVKAGKVYAMPAKFSVPIIYGSEEAVNSAASIEMLVEYAHNSEEIPLILPCNYRSLAAWSLLLYYDQIAIEKGEFDEALLKKFFENMKDLSADIMASDDAQIHAMGTESEIKAGYWVSGAMEVHKKLVQTNIEEISDFNGISIPLAVADKWKGSYKIINNTYRAHALVGINSAGNQKELAREFVRLLFSDNIQSVKLMDGFPMNRVAMEKLVGMVESGVNTVTVGEYDVQGEYPTVAEKEQLYEAIGTLTGPMENDTTVVDMILDEAERYLRGDITAEIAAKNAVNSINTYLSE
ncbi:MAG TPA: ABC transporter substrate-binding protein [Mobilitalea sp.]|nr:ABC transporter substrate-binding protein [Mobilitalea sp.]